MIGMPRIQGKLVQVESPKELEGYWTFELFMQIIGSGNTSQSIFKAWDSDLIFKTKPEAHDKMMEAVKFVCDDIQKKTQGFSDGKYVDLKTNEAKIF